MHPWNAPPAGGIVGRENPVWGRIEGGTPMTWNVTRWGYNEWNRVTDGEASAVRPLAGNVAPNMTAFASVLAAGNGGQVVTYPSFTYIANIATGGNEQDVVAYSYDGYDSPFEYVEKMRQQYAILGAKRDADTTAGIETNIPSPIELIKAPLGTWKNYAALNNTGLDLNGTRAGIKTSHADFASNNIVTWTSG